MSALVSVFEDLQHRFEKASSVHEVAHTFGEFLEGERAANPPKNRLATEPRASCWTCHVSDAVNVVSEESWLWGTEASVESFHELAAKAWASLPESQKSEVFGEEPRLKELDSCDFRGPILYVVWLLFVYRRLQELPNIVSVKQHWQASGTDAVWNIRELTVGCFEASATAIGSLLSEWRKEEPHVEGEEDRPTWNKDTCELRYAGKLAKKLRPIADSQILILGAFQSQDWPERIENPLLTDDKQRMRETVRHLNERCKGIKFRSDGTGEGIRWEPLGPS